MMQKLEHRFEERQRVKLRHKGAIHHGRIEQINRSGHLNILLDSGHHVLAHAANDEVEPADFESGSVEPAPPKLTDAQRAELRAAVKTGKLNLNPGDKYLVEVAFQNLAEHRGLVLNPLASLEVAESHDQTTLTIMFEKYMLGTLAKRASSARFAVGDAVRERRGGRVGKVAGIRPSGVVEVLLSNGIEMHCTADSIEAAA